jgi:1,4-alpha-glucan branching enzyme
MAGECPLNLRHRPMVSYERKHNEANQEENRDGHDDNISANHGVEGVTDDPKVLEVRRRQIRNFLATLLFSQGVPMLSGGDEFMRTQQGNNNGYCQDNELTWYDWELDEPRRRLLEYTCQIIRLRKEYPTLCRRKFFQGRPLRGSGITDILFLRPDGEPMGEEEWNAGWARSLAIRLNGDAADVVDANGVRLPCVLYEMHIGTFTPGGTFHAAMAELPGLSELGVTTLELMPLGAFPGQFGWGYDGVCLFAPYSEYGRPDDLRALVNAAHRVGLAVILDVGRETRRRAGPRQVTLAVENEPQDTRMIRKESEGGLGLDAAWNDDFHHSAMVAMTARNDAYYTDYEARPQEFISALKWGYLYQGQRYKWQNARRGTPSLDLFGGMDGAVLGEEAVVFGGSGVWGRWDASVGDRR